MEGVPALKGGEALVRDGGADGLHGGADVGGGDGADGVGGDGGDGRDGELAEREERGLLAEAREVGAAVVGGALREVVELGGRDARRVAAEELRDDRAARRVLVSLRFPCR